MMIDAIAENSKIAEEKILKGGIAKKMTQVTIKNFERCCKKVA